MLSKAKKTIQSAILLATVPLLAGCGGGGAALALGSLFGGAAGAGLAGGGNPLGGGGDAVATITNPEPASMLLLGSGMAAMAYFQGKKNKNTKA